MVTLHGRGPHSGRAGLAAVALVAAVLTLGLPLLSYRSVTSLTQGQQQVGAGAGAGRLGQEGGIRRSIVAGRASLLGAAPLGATLVVGAMGHAGDHAVVCSQQTVWHIVQVSLSTDVSISMVCCCLLGRLVTCAP